jgi:hypothetical protein
MLTTVLIRRPELDRLLADAKRRRFDVLVCWRLDRLGGNLRHLITLLDELQILGVSFVSPAEGIDATRPNRWIANDKRPVCKAFREEDGFRGSSAPRTESPYLESSEIGYSLRVRGLLGVGSRSALPLRFLVIFDDSITGG